MLNFIIAISSTTAQNTRLAAASLNASQPGSEAITTMISPSSRGTAMCFIVLKKPSNRRKVDPETSMRASVTASIAHGAETAAM